MISTDIKITYWHSNSYKPGNVLGKEYLHIFDERQIINK